MIPMFFPVYLDYIHFFHYSYGLYLSNFPVEKSQKTIIITPELP